METVEVTLAERVQLDLSRWIGKAVDDGLTTDQALAELRVRRVPWQAQSAAVAKAAKPKPKPKAMPAKLRKTASRT